MVRKELLKDWISRFCICNVRVVKRSVSDSQHFVVHSAQRPRFSGEISVDETQGLWFHNNLLSTGDFELGSKEALGGKKKEARSVRVGIWLNGHLEICVVPTGFDMPVDHPLPYRTASGISTALTTKYQKEIRASLLTCRAMDSGRTDIIDQYKSYFYNRRTELTDN